jgi:hypothetical protein
MSVIVSLDNEKALALQGLLHREKKLSGDVNFLCTVGDENEQSS